MAGSALMPARPVHRAGHAEYQQPVRNAVRSGASHHHPTSRSDCQRWIDRDLQRWHEWFSDTDRPWFFKGLRLPVRPAPRLPSGMYKRPAQAVTPLPRRNVSGSAPARATLTVITRTRLLLPAMPSLYCPCQWGDAHPSVAGSSPMAAPPGPICRMAGSMAERAPIS